MVARIIDDLSGDLRTGYFYSIGSDLSSIEKSTEEFPDGWISSPIEMVDYEYNRVYGGAYVKSEVVATCSIDADHSSGVENITTGAECYLFGGPTLYPFIPCEGYLLVNQELARSLRDSRLKGVKPIQCTIGENQSGVEEPIIFILQAEGRQCWKPLVVSPPDANQCPWCGEAPVLCPECGTIMGVCRRCRRKCVALLEWHKGKKDKRISLTPTSDEGLIVDAERWDGSDFNCGNGTLVTKRALDFLLSVHARPFVAQPMRTDVSGLTDEQWKRLEQATKPIT